MFLPTRRRVPGLSRALLALLAIVLLGTIAAGQRHRIVHGGTERPDLHALHQAQHACAAFDALALGAPLPAPAPALVIDAGPGPGGPGARAASTPGTPVFHFSARAPPAISFLSRRLCRLLQPAF